MATDLTTVSLVLAGLIADIEQYKQNIPFG